MNSPPLNGKPQGANLGQLSETSNTSDHHKDAAQASDSPWLRCSRPTCGVLTHRNVATGLGDRPRCLACGHDAVPVDLAAERRIRAGG
jgi:hypothetical protein